MTLSRGSTLAGHVIIDDNAHIGTNAGVVQRSRIGRFAAVSAESAVSGADLRLQLRWFLLCFCLYRVRMLFQTLKRTVLTDRRRLGDSLRTGARQ